MNRSPIRWGILGTGAVARLFARDLQYVPDAKLMAVGSRSDERAQAFGEDFDIPNRHGRYAALAEDPDVDVVYIATPASVHRDNMLLCVSARKPVLCEKPFTVTAREAQEVVGAARQAGVFVMEAMWTRFLPVMVKLRAVLGAGTIGDVRYLIADLGAELGPEPKARLVSPELGGGALLQRGIYLVSLASMLFGPPNRVTSLAGSMATGVDEESAVLLGHERGQMALLLCSLRARTSREATVIGTTGRIRIGPPVHCPSRLTLYRSQGADNGLARPSLAAAAGRLKERLVRYGKHSRVVRRLREHYWALGERLVHGERTNVFRAPVAGEGLHYQAAEVMRCLREGRMESEVMSLEESVAIIETTDRIREQWTRRRA